MTQTARRRSTSPATHRSHGWSCRSRMSATSAKSASAHFTTNRSRSLTAVPALSPSQELLLLPPSLFLPRSTHIPSSFLPAAPLRSRSAFSRLVSGQRRPRSPSPVTILVDHVASRFRGRPLAAPSPSLARGTSVQFDLGRRAERTISVHNVGNCDLRVLKVAFLPDERKPGCHDRDDCGCGCGPGCGCGCGCDDQLHHGHEHEDEHRQHKSDQCCATFKIDSNPFPVRLRPGASMPVLLRFIPTCAGPQCCELLIETDDPATPRTIVFVTGSLHRTLRAAVKCWVAEEIQDLLKAGKHW